MVAEATIGSMGTACMRRFVLGWKTLGCQQRLKACIVNWLNSKHKVHCIGKKRFMDEATANRHRATPRLYPVGLPLLNRTTHYIAPAWMLRIHYAHIIMQNRHADFPTPHTVLLMVLLAGVVCCWPLVLEAAPQTAPTTTPTTEPSPEVQAILKDMQTTGLELSYLIVGDGPMPMYHPESRKDIAPEAVPRLQRMEADLSRLREAHAPYRLGYSLMHLEDLAELSALGDKAATEKLAAMAASSNAEEALFGQEGQLQARWYLAGESIQDQAKVVDDVQKLAQLHPTDMLLPWLVATFAEVERTKAPELKQRLETIITDTMKDPTAAMFARQIQERRKADMKK